MSEQQYDAAIVGASIAGCTAATLLAGAVPGWLSSSARDVA